MIFYFSGTGNSQWAANTLALYTSDKLISIPEVINTDCSFTLGKDEHVGFVFPVHGWRVPLIVREFIEKLTFLKDDLNLQKPHVSIIASA